MTFKRGYGEPTPLALVLFVAGGVLLGAFSWLWTAVEDFKAWVRR